MVHSAFTCMYVCTLVIHTFGSECQRVYLDELYWVSGTLYCSCTRVLQAMFVLIQGHLQ